MSALQLVLLPIVAAALWYGLGALVAAAATARSDQDPPHRVLWPVLGFAACVVLANGLPRLGLVMPLTAIVIVAAAAAGFWLRRRSLLGDRTTALWAAVGAAPVALAFVLVFATTGPTITGYLLDTNTGVHSLGADYLLHQGGDFKAIERDSTASALLAQFFADATYPSGSHAVYGLLGSLTGVPLLWVNSPLMAILLVLTALTAPVAARGLGAPRPTAAVAGVLASCGALTVAFALSGQLKEVSALPVLVAATALVCNPAAFGSARSQLGAAVLLAAALFSIFGPSGVAWGAPLVVLVLLRGAVQAAAGARLRTGALSTAAAIGLGLLLVAPLLPVVADQIGLARALSQTNAQLAADPGNLLGPIGKEQALGPWISVDHRLPPQSPRWTGVGLGIVALLAVAGLYACVRRRAWWPLLWFAGLMVLWVALTARGTLWIDSKLVMLNGHVFAVLAAAGIARLSQRGEQARPDWLLAGGLAAAALVIVAWSDAQLVRSTGTASQGRFDELTEIAERFEGRGPTLLTEFDEYGLYALRKLDPTGPGFVVSPGLSKLRTDGTGVGYGQSVEVDRIPFAEVERYPLVITATGPTRSAPGSAWQEAWKGTWWTVWERDERAPRIIEHLPVDGPVAATAAPRCRDVRRAARLAEREGGELRVRVASAPSKAIAVTPKIASPNWAAALAGGPGVSGAGALNVPVPAAQQATDHTLWLSGVLGRPLQVLDQNGRELGRLPRRIGGDGSIVGPVTIPAGTTALRIETLPPELRAGAGAPVFLFQLVLEPVGEARVETISASDAERRLCADGVAVDWIDVVER